MHNSFFERVMITLIPLVMAFILGVFFRDNILLNQNLNEYNILLIIIFSLSLAYFIYHQLRQYG